MSQSLEFRITASDQASRVVTEVQKKVQDFGKNIGASVSAIIGPMAILTMSISKVTSMLEEARRKSQEAFSWGAGLASQAAALNITAEELQKLQKVAEDTGIPLDRVASAFKEANKVIAEAKAGNKDAIESLRQLGIKVEDLDKTQPEEVIGKLGRAMSSIESPIDKAAAAFAVFGAEGKKLIETLEQLRNITNAGPIEGLSTEESEQLRLLEKTNREKANRERLGAARIQGTAAAIQNDPFIFGVAMNALTETQRGGVRGALSDDPNIRAQQMPAVSADMAKNQAVQDAVREALRVKAGLGATSDKPTAGETATGEGLVELGKERTAKPEKVAKPKKPDKPDKVDPFGEAVTVSSLRSIGGGMAGEVAGGVDYQQIQADLQREMVNYLRDISYKLMPSSDPTKEDDGSLKVGPLNASSRIGLA